MPRIVSSSSTATTTALLSSCHLAAVEEEKTTLQFLSRQQLLLRVDLRPIVMGRERDSNDSNNENGSAKECLSSFTKTKLQQAPRTDSMFVTTKCHNHNKTKAFQEKASAVTEPVLADQRQEGDEDDQVVSSSPSCPPLSACLPSSSQSSSSCNSNSSNNNVLLQDTMITALRDEQWNVVERLCRDHPSVARQPISMVCQGENSTCLPLHFASGQKSVPLSTIQALVAAYPDSVMATESSGGRLALHIAVLKGTNMVVEYLTHHAMNHHGIQPPSVQLSQADQDGNLPLHYAAMYGSNAMIQLLVKAYPEACAQVNSRSDRLPLHLLCARCWDTTAADPEAHIVSVETMKLVLEHYPDAVKAADRRGRLPLHVCCSSHPRADIVQLLVDRYPPALLVTDKSKWTPLDLARTFSSSTTTSSSNDEATAVATATPECCVGNGSNNVVLAYLIETTNRERRKKYKFLAPFKHVGNRLARRRYQAKQTDVDALHLHYCYG